MAQQTVTVPALIDFEFGGRMYRRGEAVIVAPVIALMLARRHEVTLSASEKPTEPVRGRRRYRRRDMAAQSD